MQTAATVVLYVLIKELDRVAPTVISQARDMLSNRVNAMTIIIVSRPTGLTNSREL